MNHDFYSKYLIEAYNVMTKLLNSIYDISINEINVHYIGHS